jgi:hypothetical protein
VSTHVHRWKVLMHTDGCHSFSSSYLCNCGAQRLEMAERDVGADPWSMIWMEPVYEMVDRDERGRYVKPHEVEVACFRCNELKAGAKPRSIRQVTFKDGSTWTAES